MHPATVADSAAYSGLQMTSNEPGNMGVKHAAQRCCAALLCAAATMVMLTPVAASSPSAGHGASAPVNPYAELMARARALVVQERMEAAYALLSTHELALAGDPDYDYLLGTAALDSGRPSLAVLALERVLDERPQFAGARLELARAYFALGNNETARYHFDYLQGQNPPPNVQQAITSYLRAIDRVAAAYQPIHLPYFSAGFGWDSNANASTDVDQFLGFALDGNNVETESPYYFAAVGDFYSRPVAPGAKLILTGSLGQRNYPDASFVNATDLTANAAIEWNFGDTKVVPGLGVALNWLDGENNLDRFVSDLAISHSLSDTWKWVGGVSAAAHRFDDDLAIQDVNVYVARLGVEHYLDPDRASVIALAASAGTESARDSQSPFGNDRWSLTLRGSRLLRPGMLLTVEAGNRRTDFDGRFFGRRRQDDLWRIAGSLHLFDWPREGWRMIGRLGYTDVGSDLKLYDYERIEAGLSFHKTFD